MMLLQKLKTKAVELGFAQPDDVLDAEETFLLVREMPYRRASSRDPETIIAEWQGTCSGKHYLLKALFAELGYASRVIACTTVNQIDPQTVPEPLQELLAQSNGRFVDVHNYLIVETPQGEMIVDATWPMVGREAGAIVNETFVLGENQQIACVPIENWEIPEGVDPQAFKNELLTTHFSEAELKHRDAFIQAIAALSQTGE